MNSFGLLNHLQSGQTDDKETALEARALKAKEEVDQARRQVERARDRLRKCVVESQRISKQLSELKKNRSI
ncbi:uncharacterized protein LY89DRAFT_690938 [Mollisia scopiformis]|uniref:Uncharacterized protein n=1 Tax=Mollisia scopiformis TaxID=149040 RepID=A0A132B920_MOLSC|nr:uncharacterized protein LY89DRAFT_690938 [Mollisia scopiformis]KUJ08489.1 hypothetical protein LY89DRAFT_690938 [Mollisia scopiformis]